MAPAQVAETQLEELPIETRSVKALQLQQLKRSFDLFAGNYGSKPDLDSGRSATQHVLTSESFIVAVFMYVLMTC